MDAEFDEEAAKIKAVLPRGSRLVVIGSTSFWDMESEQACIEIGKRLAEIPDLTLITGGVEGVGDTMARAFYRTTRNEPGSGRLFHVLPEGCRPRPYGRTLFAGATMEERREVLGRVAELYLSVEGGPGTAHEARVAIDRGATVIPVGRSGGFSGELYDETECPHWATADAWQSLAAEVISPRGIADAVWALISKRLVMSERSASE